MNCKPNNSCCSPTQQWKEILLNTQDKAIQAYNLAQQALDEIENLPAGGGSVQSVNGELPDQDGEVTIDTGVMTVNGVSPDADGEVTITAGSNITITPDAGTNSIEISASGGTPQAVAPIYIDGDGKIALEDWQLVTTTDWSIYKDSNNCATEDMLLFMCGNNGHDDTFIPKGVKLTTIGMNIVLGKTGSTGAFVTSIDSVNTFFNSNNSVTAYQSRTGIGDSLISANTIEESFYVYGARDSVTINKLTDTTSISGIRLYVRRH